MANLGMIWIADAPVPTIPTVLSDRFFMLPVASPPLTS